MAGFFGDAETLTTGTFAAGALGILAAGSVGAFTFAFAPFTVLAVVGIGRNCRFWTRFDCSHTLLRIGRRWLFLHRCR